MIVKSEGFVAVRKVANYDAVRRAAAMDPSA